MNRDAAYRYMVYSLLQAIQIDPGTGLIDIPVFDEKLEDDALIYVILDSQTAVNASNFVNHCWNCTIDIQISHKQQNSATFEIVDQVSQEIESRLLNATPSKNNFPAVTGWNVFNTILNSSSNLKLQSTQDSGFESIKILQFSSQLVKI
jgi:hypothetical protein